MARSTDTPRWRPKVAGCLVASSVAGVVAALSARGVALGQMPTLPDPIPGRASASTSLGPTPGAGGAPVSEADDALLGGRPGTSTPRVPASISRPGRSFRPPDTSPSAPASARDRKGSPLFGEITGPPQAVGEDEPNGLTLEQAIDRVVRCNLDLRAKQFEIPLARADVLTAGLRANPILYADGQLVPYGQFTPARPGGATQYDLNVSYPVDISGKRKARVEVAGRAVKVLEAQFQDVVRQEVDAMAASFVDLLAAIETVRQAKVGVEGLSLVVDETRRLRDRGLTGDVEVDRLGIQLRSAELALADAREVARRSTRALGLTLNLPPDESNALRVRGRIRVEGPELPPAEELGRMALACRPDIVAARLGVERARSDVKLAHAERLSDVYVLYQPYTFQNNAPFGTKSAHSWALGVSVPLPVYNRNQGNIARSKVNVAQSVAEVDALERRAVTEVEQSVREYEVAQSATRQVEADILPAALRIRDDAERLFLRGESEVVAYLNARREYNDVVREYRDLLVRRRRSMLGINSAVGARVMP